MAVLVEGISVIIQDEKLAKVIYWEDFKEMVPNQTLCADGELVRVGFMHPDDVKFFVSELEALGLQYLDKNSAVDLCVVDQQAGPMVSVDWLEFGSVEMNGKKVAAARLCGSEVGQIFTPEGWAYHGSLSERFLFVRSEDPDSLEVVGRKGLMDIVRTTLSDAPMFIARIWRK